VGLRPDARQHRKHAVRLKTRRFDNIVAELEAAFRVHSAMGSRLGGVHFELTGEDVTECTGGARGLVDGDLVAGLPLAGRPAPQLRAGPRTRDADRRRGTLGLGYLDATVAR
jgi:hypothetical protein